MKYDNIYTYIIIKGLINLINLNISLRIFRCFEVVAESRFKHCINSTSKNISCKKEILVAS